MVAMQWSALVTVAAARGLAEPGRGLQLGSGHQGLGGHQAPGTWHLAPADLRCCLPEAESRRRNARPTSRARNVEDSGERVLVLVVVRAREALLGVLTGTRMCEEQFLHKHCTL